MSENRSREVVGMASPEASVLEIKVEGLELEFLESKAEELGISREELARLYIVRAIDAEREKSRPSLEGLFKDGPPIAKEFIDEVIEEWNKTGSL
jgi:hypothetical protein